MQQVAGQVDALARRHPGEHLGGRADVDDDAVERPPPRRRRAPSRARRRSAAPPAVSTRSTGSGRSLGRDRHRQSCRNGSRRGARRWTMTDDAERRTQRRPGGQRRSATPTCFEQLMASIDPPMFVADRVRRHRAQRVPGRLRDPGQHPTAAVHGHGVQGEPHLRRGDRRAPAGGGARAAGVRRAAIAEHFGELTGDEVDKFDGLDVVEGPARAPVLVGLDWFAGRVLRTVDCGDHVGLLLAPHDGVGGAGRRAAVRHARRGRDRARPPGLTW